MAQESVPPGRTGYQGQEGLLDLEALQQQVALLEADLLTRTRWMGPWVAGDYVAKDQVIDGGWLMIANKDTGERPAPQQVGEPYYEYSGTSPTGQLTAKTLSVGQRYTLPTGGWVTGYRVYQITDNEYRVYVVRDPDGAAEVSEILWFTGSEDGWREFGVEPIVVVAGEVFEFYVTIAQPDPTPTTWAGDWNYTTPNNNGTPAAGDVLHANKSLGILRVDDDDDGGTDRSAELLALTAGDTISTQGVTWVIQSAPTDGGSYVEFAIAPATQAPSDGVSPFVFQTMTATPMTTVSDPGYWSGDASVGGFYSIDGAPPVVTDEQYGVDVMFQDALVSADWDFQALTE